MLGRQAPTSVMMVRPDQFGYNEETAASNSFQQSDRNANLNEIRAIASKEFNDLLLTLKGSGVAVVEFGSDDGLETPDAVFPNNWVSFHPDGKVILYPMMAPSRRRERRLHFITALEKQYNYEVGEVIDLSHHEQNGEFLEGTGSLVMDYEHEIIYANYSPRTNLKLVKKVSELLGYQVCPFKAVDSEGIDIYHTNVMMCVAASFAVVCLESLEHSEDKSRLEKSLEATGHEVINISRVQMNRFAGNMMELCNDKGESVLAMSSSAFNSLSNNQLQALENHSTIVHSAIDTIEKYGGGSVRCMMAGIYLPKKQGKHTEH